jgi:hypothetical protein
MMVVVMLIMMIIVLLTYDVDYFADVLLVYACYSL